MTKTANFGEKRLAEKSLHPKRSNKISAGFLGTLSLLPSGNVHVAELGRCLGPGYRPIFSFLAAARGGGGKEGFPIRPPSSVQATYTGAILGDAALCRLLNYSKECAASRPLLGTSMTGKRELMSLLVPVRDYMQWTQLAEKAW